MLWLHFRRVDEACGEVTLIVNCDGERAMRASLNVSRSGRGSHSSEERLTSDIF